MSNAPLLLGIRKGVATGYFKMDAALEKIFHQILQN